MSDDVLRKQLIQLLQEGQAHITLNAAVDRFPADKAGIRPAGSPHSAWELLEHIRIAQQDISLFSGVSGSPTGSDRYPKGYEPLKWPDDYWPPSPAPQNREDWKKSIVAINEDLKAFIDLIRNPKRDLFQPFPWGDGQNLLREALLIADHNAYHVGQIMLVRRMLE